MRTGLTQRGWNNVLIFASLFMIILFNLTHQRFVENDEQASLTTLVPESAVIQSIDFSGIKFERLGSSWRTLTEISLTEELQPAEYISKWQSIEVSTTTESLSVQNGKKQITVAIAGFGIEGIQQFVLVFDNPEELLYIHNMTENIWYMTQFELLFSLVPQPLIGE